MSARHVQRVNPHIANRATKLGKIIVADYIRSIVYIFLIETFLWIHKVTLIAFEVMQKYT